VVSVRPLLPPVLSRSHTPRVVVPDRRPIDPPPIVELVVRNKSNVKAKRSGTSARPTDAGVTVEETAQVKHSRPNHGYFMVASLCSPDQNTELQFLDVSFCIESYL
jgi:hypothetical protein